jgi:hypothetical protein
MAMVVYEEPIEGVNADATTVRHVHKDPYCQVMARRRAGHRHAEGPWDELGEHLVLLVAGLGITPDNYRERYVRLMRMGMIHTPTDE